jgi:hypothetical protein
LNNSPKHRSARFVANGTFGRDGQIAFHPLMWHGDVLRHSSKQQFKKIKQQPIEFKKSFTPSSSSMISLPTLANVVHLQLLMALTAHLLCDLNLQTSQLNPCDVTPDFKKFIYISGKFKI